MVASQELSAPTCAVLSPAITSLFPPGVVAAELRGFASAVALLPEELDDCLTFGARRIADFAAGRQCARRALAELGISQFPLRRDADRRPRWPAAIVGSISHTSGFCGAVVAPNQTIRSLGFDAELSGRVDEELWPSLFTPAEIARLRLLPYDRQRKAATIAFSAKEAYYKSQFGVTAAWLEFTDVTIELEKNVPDRGTFRVYTRNNSLTGLHAIGKYTCDQQLTLTGIAMLTTP